MTKQNKTKKTTRGFWPKLPTSNFTTKYKTMGFSAEVALWFFLQSVPSFSSLPICLFKMSISWNQRKAFCLDFCFMGEEDIKKILYLSTWSTIKVYIIHVKSIKKSKVYKSEQKYDDEHITFIFIWSRGEQTNEECPFYS